MIKWKNQHMKKQKNEKNQDMIFFKKWNKSTHWKNEDKQKNENKIKTHTKNRKNQKKQDLKNENNENGQHCYWQTSAF